MTFPTHIDPAPADQAGDLSATVPADGESLRGVLRQMASPVVVVTCVAPDGPRGATIGSFTSVSLAPPLISFNVTHGTRLHEALQQTEAFAVHVLSARQATVATTFARADLDGPEQLAATPHRISPRGLPVLHGTLGVLLCRPHATIEAGDHTLVLGRVEEILPGEDDGEPLLYVQQSYRGVGREV